MIKSKNISGTKITCEYDSSNIKKAEYETTNDTLVITFNNDTIYEYYKVPHSVFAEFNIADSQGKIFHSKIKKHEFKKIIKE